MKEFDPTWLHIPVKQVYWSFRCTFMQIPAVFTAHGWALPKECHLHGENSINIMHWASLG